jgi:hypothetical protein
MMIRVDRRHVESLLAHLSAQGFPARRVGDDGLDVLFPASPPLFAAAVELDEWLARTDLEAAVRIEA